MKKDIVSAVLGSTFFAIPYTLLSVAFAPSLIIGGAAFTASELVFSNSKKKETLKESNKSLYDKLFIAKKQNREITAMISKIENEETRNNLKEITATVAKIIDTIEYNPRKAKKNNNFFDYYMPVLLKIVKRYDDIENKRLISKDGKEFMSKADKMIKDTNNAFKTMLSNLYEEDINDADADMKVYNLMLKADGIVEDNVIMKGSDKDEE